MDQLMAADMNSCFSSPFGRTQEDTSKDLPSSAGSIEKQDISLTQSGQKSFPCPSQDKRKEMCAEIADLVGERFTVRARLEWLEVRIKTLQDQLRDLNG